MGVGKGGFYGYDWLENLGPADVLDDIRNADGVHPEWQDLTVGGHGFPLPGATSWTTWGADGTLGRARGRCRDAAIQRARRGEPGRHHQQRQREEAVAAEVVDEDAELSGLDPDQHLLRLIGLTDLIGEQAVQGRHSDHPFSEPTAGQHPAVLVHDLDIMMGLSPVITNEQHPTFPSQQQRWKESLRKKSRRPRGFRASGAGRGGTGMVETSSAGFAVGTCAVVR